MTQITFKQWLEEADEAERLNGDIQRKASSMLSNPNASAQDPKQLQKLLATKVKKPGVKNDPLTAVKMAQAGKQVADQEGK